MANTLELKNQSVNLWGKRKGKDQQGNATVVKRRLQIKLDNDRLDEIPAELFNVKVSQSTKPELAGKTLFKYFSMKTTDGTWSQETPEGTTLATDLNELKEKIVASLAGKDIELYLTFPWSGSFGNIDTSNGRFVLFDDKQFPSDDVSRQGYPGYYLNPNTKVDVHLTPAISNNNMYYQIRLTTDKTAEEVLVKPVQTQVWDPEGHQQEEVTEPEPEEEAGGVW